MWARLMKLDAIVESCGVIEKKNVYYEHGEGESVHQE